MSQKRLNRREFLRLASIASSAFALNACGAFNGEMALETTSLPLYKNRKLVVWVWSGTFEGMQTQIKPFNLLYPDIQVDMKITGYDDTHINLLNALFAGTGAPDICAIDVYRLPELADSLVDISDLARDKEDQFVPPTLSVATYKGKIYGLPTDAQPVGMFYRKDIFDQFGLSENDVQTWDDVLTMGEIIEQHSKKQVKAYIVSSSDPLLFEVMAVQSGFPGFYFNDDDTKVIVDHPALIEAVEMIKKLWNGKGCLQNPQGGIAGDETNSVIKQNKLAAQIIGPAWYPQVLKGILPEQSSKWRLMRVPSINKDTPRIGYGIPTIFVITRQSSLIDPAWDLCLLTLTGDGAKALYDKTGILPAYKPLMEDIMDTPVDYFGGQKVNRLYYEISNDTPNVFFGKGFAETRAIFGKHLERILVGGIPVKQGMLSAATEIREKLEKG